MSVLYLSLSMRIFPKIKNEYVIYVFAIKINKSGGIVLEEIYFELIVIKQSKALILSLYSNISESFA